MSLHVCWGDCDPAGIVYFPRFFEKFHEVMEQWFGDALGVAYNQLIVKRHLGLPSVHTEADFHRPCRFGERLVIELRVLRLGRSSLELGYRVQAKGETSPKLVGRTVCVLTGMDPTQSTLVRSIPWPDDLRAKIEAFGVTSSPPLVPGVA